MSRRIPAGSNLFARNLGAGTTSLVTVTANGQLSNATLVHAVLSPDGQALYFTSDASDLAPIDFNGGTDIFVATAPFEPTPGIEFGSWQFTAKETDKQATIYVIRTGKGARGHQVPEDILGPDCDGYLVVDGLKSYDVLEVAKGRCNGHLLRRCRFCHVSPPLPNQTLPPLAVMV